MILNKMMMNKMNFFNNYVNNDVANVANSVFDNDICFVPSSVRFVVVVVATFLVSKQNVCVCLLRSSYNDVNVYVDV